MVLFQATNGSPVMRFSNATHVCAINNTRPDDQFDDAESAFAVVHLLETGGRPAGNINDDGDDMFTDIPMDASACAPSGVSLAALLVVHDLAVAARAADASDVPVPATVLPVPKVLPSTSYMYVLSYNSRLRRGQEVS